MFPGLRRGAVAARLGRLALFCNDRFDVSSDTVLLFAAGSHLITGSCDALELLPDTKTSTDDMIAGSPRSRLATVFRAPDQDSNAAPTSAFDAMRGVQPSMARLRLSPSRSGLQSSQSPRAAVQMEAQVSVPRRKLSQTMTAHAICTPHLRNARRCSVRCANFLLAVCDYATN